MDQPVSNQRRRAAGDVWGAKARLRVWSHWRGLRWRSDDEVAGLGAGIGRRSVRRPWHHQPQAHRRRPSDPADQGTRGGTRPQACSRPGRGRPCDPVETGECPPPSRSAGLRGLAERLMPPSGPIGKLAPGTPSALEFLAVWIARRRSECRISATRTPSLAANSAHRLAWARPPSVRAGPPPVSGTLGSASPCRTR
jgi:hypothetical protein